MERGGGTSRPNSFYSQTSSSSCCSLGDSKTEMRDLMDSFIADVQRIRQTFADPSPADTAPPARSDGDVEMAPPVPGAYEIDRPSTPMDNYEHKGIWCDSCKQKVLGVRHKCLDCYNFDLCNSCMTTKDIQSTHADMPHTFEAIHPPKSTRKAPARGGSRPSSPLPKCLCAVLPRPLGCEVCKTKKAPASKRTPSYRCDSCQNIIGSTRHKCMNCSDFDLCEACYASGFPVFDHSPVHRFMHIEHPVRVVTAPAMVVSDAISPLAGACVHEGPRYKCENCDDADLCTDCLGNLERAIVQHAAWHVEQRSDKPVRFVPYTKDPKPQTPTTPSATPLPVHEAECDACDNTIVGTRHKCVVCHDFDLCDACYKAGAQPMSHKTEHEMLHLERPQRVVTHLVGASRGPISRAVATSSTPIAAPAIHNAWCDACSERIRGIRHKCLDCPDFDFCNACIEAESQTHHGGEHTFYPLREPGQVVVRDVPEEQARSRGRPNSGLHVLPHIPEPPASRSHVIPPAIPAPPAPPVLPPAHQAPRPALPGPPSNPAAHAAACDMCSSRIRGVRYKCTACPDYDVCESCFRVSEEVHPGHSFAKVYKQSDIIVRKSPQAAYRHHARCDVCQKQIFGVRYKCIHPSCPDFDICEPCEALPFAVHPETHAFVKLKSHISNYDGLKNVINFAAGRASQPQPTTIREPVPTVRIPTPRLHIPVPHASKSPIAAYPEPVTSTEVFHTATPSPIVPLSTLGCTIVPHSTIVPSLPHSPVPSPPRMSPQTVSPPAIPSPIQSPPPIPVPERKLTDSWTAASSSAKLDEHKMHHSDMYKPSYEAPPVVQPAEQRWAEIENMHARLSQSRGRRSHGVEVSPHPAVMIQEERDPEAPQMTVLNSRPVSLPDVPAHEPVIHVPSPRRVPVPVPQVIRIGSPMSDDGPRIIRVASPTRSPVGTPHVVRIPEVVSVPEPQVIRVGTPVDSTPSIIRVRTPPPRYPEITHISASSVATPAVPEIIRVGCYEPNAIRVGTPEPASDVPMVVRIGTPPVVNAEPVARVASPEPAPVEPVHVEPTTVEPVRVASPEPTPVEPVREPLLALESVPTTPEPELPSLLPTYPYSDRHASEERGPIPDMVSLASSPSCSSSSSSSSASLLSYTPPPFEAAFIEDRTIVDGQVVSGGAEFSKIWRMRNTGTVAWPEGTTVSFVGGNYMTTAIHWAVTGDLSPGQDIDVEVDMKAPEEPGHYNSTWRLKTPEGETFGSVVWCDIIVAEIERAGSSGNSEVSASSIIVPTRAPGMSVATISSVPASPEVQSISSTIRTPSVTDMADDDDLSMDSEDSDDSIWHEVRRRGQTSPQ
ncbi:unnamed protein product [Rhizoctonia solani]|uniref:ZZ-type domain-containing protein n=1 Tax=Rhizoctonia solani TaxID=456999 RepID=A0A8H3DVW7_9AGAM|nr:unnamed protein product [Rhizoctonia solani]